MRRIEWFLAVVAMSAACSTPTSSGPGPQGDAEVDASQPDVADDASPDAPSDAAPDGTPQDSGPDVTPVDVETDAPSDATPDAPVDATPDAPADATMDATMDATVDATVDASPDVAVDASPDVAADVTPDVAADAPVDAGGPAMELWVLRVGTGTGSLTNASTAVFLERRSAADGSMRGATIALPIAMTGANRPITLSGTATSEGALARSADGRFVTFAGYAVAPGTASVATSSSTDAPRVVARVAGDGTVDTTTTLGMAYSGNNVRGAVTNDGSAFWVSGTGSPGGIHYKTLGPTGDPTYVVSMPSNVRTVNLFDGQLYASASTSTPTPGFYGIFHVGTGLPTTADTAATTLPGFPTMSGPSPYGFVMLDRSATVAGPDTLYVADDRSLASGGGVQRWTLSGGTWTLGATFNMGLTSGVRGVTAWASGADVMIAATTAENPSRLVVFRDQAGAAPGAATALAVAASNTQFRGVALAPTP